MDRTHLLRKSNIFDILTHLKSFSISGKKLYFFNYSLETNSITCGIGKWQLQGFIHNFQLNASSSTTSKNPETPVENGITSNGYLKYENEFYPPGSFCVNGYAIRTFTLCFVTFLLKAANTLTFNN